MRRHANPEESGCFGEVQPIRTEISAPKVGQTSGAQTHVFQETEAQQREHLHVLTDRQLSARATSSRRHCALVSAQDVDDFVRERLARVFHLGRHGSLDGFICKECRERDLVDRTVKLRDVVRRWERKGYDSDASLTLRIKINIYLIKPYTETKTYHRM